MPKESALSLTLRATDSDKLVRETSFKEFDGMDLRRRDLRFANFYGAVLLKADLRDGDLRHADLRWTQLQRSQLINVKLDGAKLIKANLQGADIRDASLQGTDLRDGKFQAADFRGSKLQGADFRGGILQDSNLSFAQLQGANLGGAKLQGSILIKAKMQVADLQKAELQGADLRGAELEAADLRLSNFQSVDLRGAVLQGGINWQSVKLDGVFISDTAHSDWNDKRQDELEAMLQLLLNKDSFTSFRQRLSHIREAVTGGVPASQKGCFSDNLVVLKCEYSKKQQIKDYLAHVLHPALIELACREEAVAEGVSSRSYRYVSATENIERHGYDYELINGVDSDFGLASALLKALDRQNPCKGLASLQYQTRQQLREAGKHSVLF